MTIGLQLCRWYYQEIGAWKCVSADFVYFHQFFSLFLTYSLSKTLKKWMTLNKVLLVRVIHMTKQFWDKIGQFDADKYAGNVLKLECYKLVHAVLLASCLTRLNALMVALASKLNDYWFEKKCRPESAQVETQCCLLFLLFNLSFSLSSFSRCPSMFSPLSPIAICSIYRTLVVILTITSYWTTPDASSKIGIGRSATNAWSGVDCPTGWPTTRYRINGNFSKKTSTRFQLMAPWVVGVDRGCEDGEDTFEYKIGLRA